MAYFYGKPFWLLFILKIWILDINKSVLLVKMLNLDIRFLLVAMEFFLYL